MRAGGYDCGHGAIGTHDAAHLPISCVGPAIRLAFNAGASYSCIEVAMFARQVLRRYQSPSQEAILSVFKSFNYGVGTGHSVSLGMTFSLHKVAPVVEWQLASP